jgi:ABC-type lipoprotein release transport system permease subunit
MKTKTNVALGIVAVAPVIVPFASGPLAASEALAFGDSIEASFVASAAGVAGSHISPIFLPNDLLSVWFLSLTTSLAAGIFPAWKASRLSPNSSEPF